MKISSLKIKAVSWGLQLSVLTVLLVIILAISCSLADVNIRDAAAYLLFGGMFGTICGLCPDLGFDKNAAQVFLFVVLIYVSICSNSLWIGVCMVIPNVILSAGIALYIQYRQAMAIVESCNDLPKRYSYPNGRYHNRNNKQNSRNKKNRKTQNQTH